MIARLMHLHDQVAELVGATAEFTWVAYAALTLRRKERRR